MGQPVYDLDARLPGTAHLVQHMTEVVQAGPVQDEHLLDGLSADSRQRSDRTAGQAAQCGEPSPLRQLARYTARCCRSRSSTGI